MVYQEGEFEKDDTTGLWEWIGQALDSPAFLRTRYAFGICVGVAATALFTHILFQMERHNATYKAAAMEAAVGERDTQLELEEDDGGNMNGTMSTKNGDYVQAGKDGSSAVSSPKNTLALSDQQQPDALYKPGDSRRRLNWIQKTQILANVAVLILFNYLLLVFQPGSVALSFFAMAVVWVLALHSYLRDELRRSRYDRFVAMVALFFVLAGCLTLITYCRLALHEGSIYEGPARIVGYDDSTYRNKDGQTMRTDLQVSWGGSWGCPDEGAKFCTATVQGALCETKYNVTDNSGSRQRQRQRRRRNRQLPRKRQMENIVTEVQDYEAEQDRDAAEKKQGDESDSTTDDKVKAVQKEADEEVEEAEEEADEEVEEAEEAADEEVEEVIDEADEAIEEVEEEDGEEIDTLNGDLGAEEEELDATKQEVTALEGKDGNSTTAAIEDNLVKVVDSEADKAAELEKENEELEEDLEEEEEYDSELEDEVEELEDYTYDDEVYEDDYWDQDWDSVWGEYACEDLFDSDVDSQKYNPNVAPGKDKWPTVMVYGSCNSCQAYIQDYYSSEHFQSISSYEFQSWLYLMIGFFLLVLAAVAAVWERVRPTKDNKVVLLSYDAGVQA